MYTQSYKPTSQSTLKGRNIAHQPTVPYSNQHSPQHDHQTSQTETKAENTKLKRILKQTQAKRIQITKECSELANKYDKLEEENMQLHRKIKQIKEVNDGEKFRYEELKFLNKQLSTQIEQLQVQNKNLNDRLKYQADVLEKKYEQLQQRTYKRIQQCLKRIKKSIHYLSSFSAKQFQKTKDIQIENLTKAAEILRGKYNQNNKFEEQIEELMNPIRNIQQDLHQKIKQINTLKEQNNRLNNQVRKHKKIQKQLLPQYKQAVQKLKKNLGQVRMQLSQNQYDKLQVKRKYEQKYKQMQIKYEELFKQHRKLKLQNKIFEKKMEEMEDDVEEEKQRLIGQNQLLKKLYKSQDIEKSKRTYSKQLDIQAYDFQQQLDQVQFDRENRIEAMSYKTTANQFRKPVQEYMQADRENQERKLSKNKNEKDANNKNVHLKKNYSASNLHASAANESKRIPLQREKQGLKLRQSPVLAPSSNQPPISQSRQSQSKRRNYDHLRHTNEHQSHQNKNIQVSDYYLKHDQNNEHNDQYDEQQNNGHEDNQYEESNINSGYREEESSVVSASQDGLKNQIFKIDQQIMEIQKTLDKELNLYK